MDANVSSRPVKSIRIYCPVDRETSKAVAEGRFSGVDAGSALAAIMAIVRGDNPLGDFGIYKSVMEMSSGWELFTPGDDANPTLGSAGTATASPTVILTVYVPGEASLSAVSNAMAAILAAHPWEVPVIEVSETTLLTRS